MIRVLTFGGSEIDKVRCKFVFSAVMYGPTVKDDGTQAHRTGDQQRTDSKVLRLLKAISDEKVERTPQGEQRSRRLKPEGGTVRLTASQFDDLKTWWNRIQWAPYETDDAADAYEWLCGAVEEKESEA